MINTIRIIKAEYTHTSYPAALVDLKYAWCEVNSEYFFESDIVLPITEHDVSGNMRIHIFKQLFHQDELSKKTILFKKCSHSMMHKVTRSVPIRTSSSLPKKTIMYEPFRNSS